MRYSLRLNLLLVLILAAAPRVLTPALVSAAADQESRATIAVFDFDYIDTSGEERDQRSEHQARLSRFMNALKGDLATPGKLHVVVPVCRPDPCSLAGTTQGDVLGAARTAGADLLLIGTIRKMSTLVQWASVEELDAKTGRLVFDKLFTFRGDTDEAWARAEAFIADEVTTHNKGDQ